MLVLVFFTQDPYLLWNVIPEPSPWLSSLWPHWLQPILPHSCQGGSRGIVPSCPVTCRVTCLPLLCPGLTHHRCFCLAFKDPCSQDTARPANSGTSPLSRVLCVPDRLGPDGPCLSRLLRLFPLLGAPSPPISSGSSATLKAHCQCTASLAGFLIVPRQASFFQPLNPLHLACPSLGAPRLL